MMRLESNHPPTASLFLELFRPFEKNLLTALYEKGFDDISSMHLNITRHLDSTGMSVSHWQRAQRIYTDKGRWLFETLN